jgi:DNA polymerase III, delta subunit
MHSFILSNFSNTKAKERIVKQANINLSIDKLNQHPDVVNINPTVNEKTILQKPSIKIEQVRNLQHQLSKKPLLLPVQMAIIWQAQFLTISSQHAFLKLLEEPLTQTLIFLIVDNYQALLPTIQSRCQIIIADKRSKPEINFDEIKIDLKTLYQSDPIKRMVLVSDSIKDQKSALLWLQALIYKLRPKLPQSSTKGMKSLAVLLKNAQQIYNLISKNNLNYKLAIDNLAISWDKPLAALDED